MILDIKNISVLYRTETYKNMTTDKRILSWLKKRRTIEEFQALKDVSFQVEKGDTLGIVGKNGAGKSTLLKAIAGTIQVQSGEIVRNGEIAALLELGLGFDRELTVKENIFLRAALLGYSREFLDQRYQEILDFSELQAYEHQPFRTLSTGMRSRLAFAIVSIVEPEILILDEVFAVGDGAFQEKSRKKMEELMKRGAATILVSHSLAQIRALCNKVLWLDRGEVVMFGATKDVCEKYGSFLKTNVIETDLH